MDILAFAWFLVIIASPFVLAHRFIKRKTAENKEKQCLAEEQAEEKRILDYIDSNDILRKIAKAEAFDDTREWHLQKRDYMDAFYNEISFVTKTDEWLVMHILIELKDTPEYRKLYDHEISEIEKADMAAVSKSLELFDLLTKIENALAETTEEGIDSISLKDLSKRVGEDLELHIEWASGVSSKRGALKAFASLCEERDVPCSYTIF